MLIWATVKSEDPIVMSSLSALTLGAQQSVSALQARLDLVSKAPDAKRFVMATLLLMHVVGSAEDYVLLQTSANVLAHGLASSASNASMLPPVRILESVKGSTPCTSTAPDLIHLRPSASLRARMGPLHS